MAEGPSSGGGVCGTKSWAQLTAVQLQQQHRGQLGAGSVTLTRLQQRQQLTQQQQQSQRKQQQLQQQQQEAAQALEMFSGWVKAGHLPKLVLEQRTGGLFISLSRLPPAADQPSAAAAAKRRSARRTARRANAKRLAKQRERRESLQRKQQAEAAAAPAAAPTSAAPCVQQQEQTAVAVSAAPAAPIAALAASSAAAATATPSARSRTILSVQNVARRETRSPSKKRKVVASTDSDTVETVSQLDGAALSPTPPTPEPAPPDFKNLPPDGDDWCTFKPSRRNPR